MPDFDFHTIHTDRLGIRKALGDLEADVMEFIWSCGPSRGLTVREVFDHFYGRKKLAYTTIMTTMGRLAKKHLLLTEKKDQTYIYFPQYTQQEFISRLIDYLLRDLSVSFFGVAKETPMDPQTAQYARQLLAELQLRQHQ